mgnify:CR=1 FL=1
MDWITNLLGRQGYLPHGYCFTWDPGLLWAMVSADALIAAYRNSNLLDQNRALLRAADEDVATSVAALRPVVNFVASASKQVRSVQQVPTTTSTPVATRTGWSGRRAPSPGCRR